MKVTIDRLLELTDRTEIRHVLNTINIETLRDREHGEGILLNAIRCRCRNRALIALLIEDKIQINTRGLYEVTPLMLASAEASQ